MTAIHEANSTPARRKPQKDWTRTPEEEATHQRMLAKCQKRADGNQAAAAPSDAELLAPTPRGSLPNSLGASKNTPAAQLCWNRISSHVMQSACQRFQVVKEIIGNESYSGMNRSNGRWTYQCWHRVQWLWYIKFEGPQKSFDDAKAVCEAYVRENPFGVQQAVA